MKRITITTYPSMPDRFRVECEQPGRREFGRDARDAGEAAAIALQYANGAGPYVILGPAVAVHQIPKELRARLA